VEDVNLTTGGRGLQLRSSSSPRMGMEKDGERHIQSHFTTKTLHELKKAERPWKEIE